MKFMILFCVSMILPSLSQAADSQKVSGGIQSYASSGLATYFEMGRDGIVRDAQSVCEATGRKVAQISDIEIQVDSAFTITSNSGTSAIDNPRVHYSATVTCETTAYQELNSLKSDIMPNDLQCKQGERKLCSYSNGGCIPKTYVCTDPTWSCFCFPTGDGENLGRLSGEAK